MADPVCSTRLGRCEAIAEIHAALWSVPREVNEEPRAALLPRRRRPVPIRETEAESRLTSPVP